MSYQIILRCDTCSTSIFVARTLAQASLELHTRGGVTRRGKDYCANCVNEGRA